MLVASDGMLKQGVRVALILLTTGCAATRSPVASPAHSPADAARSHTIEVAPLVVSPYTEAELAARFERGRALLLAEKYKEAAEIFDQLVRLSPDGEVAPPSLYNSAVAHEGLLKRTDAVGRYQDLVTRFPAHVTARGALFRLARLYGYLER